MAARSRTSPVRNERKLSLFAPRLAIDADELEFQLATFQWLIGEFGPVGDTSLVLPTEDWFPRSGRSGRERIEELFGQVRAAAGMEQWACTLVAGESDRSTDAGNTHLIRHEGPQAPCGTFRLTGSDGAPTTAEISYNPAMAGDLAALVATFAHELGHYLLATAANPPPGGWDLHELHTDLAAVYLGFGIFLANSARSFGQFQDAVSAGWSMRSQGYLSEAALIVALVLFQSLAGRDPMEAAPHLKDYLRKDLRRAARALDRSHPNVEAAVAAVDPADWSGGE